MIKECCFHLSEAAVHNLSQLRAHLRIKKMFPAHIQPLTIGRLNKVLIGQFRTCDTLLIQ